MKKAGSNSYLTTGEVEHFLGTTRRKLAECASKGVVEPFTVNGQESADRRWTIDQAQTMGHVSELRRNGYSFSDITALIDQGHDALCSDLLDLRMKELRQARRGARSLARYRQEQRSCAAVADHEGFYLRYLPQRAFALAPALDEGERMGGAERMRLLTQLIGVAQVVGWCPVTLTGGIASFSGDWRAQADYACCELAAQPQPRVRAGGDLDGGCYRVVGDRRDIACSGRCEACARFGRPPTEYERFTWDARDRTQPQLHGRAACSGAWQACSAALQMMPQEALLPFGVGACTLPAGVYLCCQRNESDQAYAFERAAGVASALPRRAATPEDLARAREAHLRIAEAKRARAAAQADASPYDEPFADPAAEGFVLDLDIGDFPRLTLLTNMALPPQTGFCVVCEQLPPTRTSDEPRFETQMLVDASGITPIGAIA